jgi:DNA (cytosine-5)-methyltransferase 1
MRFGSLFSGIGGMDLGLERAGMECAWQVEIDPYCRAVLEKHWPNVPRWDDAKTFCADAEGQRWEAWRAGRELGVDLICGGFPCQPVSVAGKRLAQADERWLWPEFARIIRVLGPRYVLVENVPGLLGSHGGFGDVLRDLAALGYDAEWDCVPAALFGAPHLRYRVVLVAYAERDGHERIGATGSATDMRRRSTNASEAVADANASGRNGRSRIFWAGWWRELADCGAEDSDSDCQLCRHRHSEQTGILKNAPGAIERIRTSVCNASQWNVEPDVGRVAHGVPARVHRLRALGNAVVPQVAEAIGRMILEHVKETTK